MAGVSHFQRYSQRENHVTNNTLLVLRHLYQVSPIKLESVLNQLLGDERLSLGLSFTQQVKGTHSVPDALIHQPDFRLYIETKLGASLDQNQLIRHIESVGRDVADTDVRAQQIILLGLATAEMRSREAAQISEFAASRGVIFSSVTFAQLVSAIESVCADYEVSLQSIITDYIDYLNSENLLYAGEDWMLVVPCGTSLNENAEHHVYYDGAHRPRRSKCRYLGLYSEKRVALVGTITHVFVATYRDGKLVVDEEERGKVDEHALSRATAIVEATTYYDLKNGPHRFYVVDRFEPTRLVKKSKGPVRGAQYLKLSEVLGAPVADLTTSALAEQLRERSFPTDGSDESGFDRT